MSMKQGNENISYRKKEIADKFIFELDKHLLDLKSGKVETSYGIKQIAELLFINPNHLSDTIKNVLGKSPCGIFEEKLIAICKELIIKSNKPINEIAYTFSYEPSNFTKLFKRYTGTTPRRFRNQHFNSKTEKDTI